MAGAGAGVCVCKAVTSCRAALGDGTAGGASDLTSVSKGKVCTGAAGVDDKEVDAASGPFFCRQCVKKVVLALGLGGFGVPCCSAGAGDMECLRNKRRKVGNFMSQAGTGMERKLNVPVTAFYPNTFPSVMNHDEAVRLHAVPSQELCEQGV